jgi:hypothetical protein
MTQQIDRDHHPEVAENGRAMRRVELLGVGDQLRDPTARRDLFANLSDDQYATFLGYVHSLSRGAAIEYDYEDGQFKGDVPPLKDKATLMDLTFETVKHILADAQFDDRTALRRAALTMAGAISLIHPYEDGNGRSGRIFHYLIEFGTERGDEAFGEELYAIIAKLPVYDTDEQVALYDTMPPELEAALNELVEGERFATPASERVVLFLDMMRGDLMVPITQQVGRGHNTVDGGIETTIIEGGQLDGVMLYEKDYIDLSAIPNRLPSQVPPGAQRVLADISDQPPIRVLSYLI